MNVYDPSKIRNVVLLGHSGSGKTTLAETMLFESGTIPRRGSISQKNTVSDYHEIEHEKLKSVFSSFMTLDWRGHKINLIDTPGTSDYIGEVIGALKVAATGIFVLDAEHGVEVGTEMLWNYTKEYQTPSLFIVNKVDHPNSNFQRTVDLAKERFGREVVVVQYPYSEGEDFNAIIDVLKMTMYEFPEEGGKPAKLPIPDSHRAQAELLHNELVEAVAENDEMLMDLYFEKGELDEDEMRDGLRRGMVNHQIFPLFCVSSERNMGTGRVMGFLDNVAPSPLDAKGPQLTNGEILKIDPDGDPLMFLFKVQSEHHVGDLMNFKVYGGTIKPGIDLVSDKSGTTNRISTLYITKGAKRIEVPEVKAGDIAAVVKLKDSAVSDTLHTKGSDIAIEPIHFPEPVIQYAVRASNESDEEKMAVALHQLQKEDPSLQIVHSAELKQTLVGGQGEEHLAVVKYMLENKYKVNIEFSQPGIPYRETITKAIRSNYKHKKQSGGAGQYGEVYMLVEPYEEGMPTPSDINVRDVQEIDLEWGGKLVFQNCIVGGVIDNRFMPAILKGIMEKMENGPLTGCRARDIRVSVYDGSMHSVDSNEAAFKTAGLMAFRKAFIDAGPKLMEPIYEVEITVPAEYMGDIMNDLSTRRGQVLGMDAEGSIQKVKANVPLAELYRYSTHLKSITQGRATHSRKFSHYAAVPRDVQEKVIKEHAELDEA
jgi:elongation factor G